MTPHDKDALAAKIVTATCSAFGITPTDFFSASRRGNLCDARRAACFLMFVQGISNVRHIAHHIGRSFATVYHHIETHRNIYRHDPKYRKKYDTAKTLLSL